MKKTYTIQERIAILKQLQNYIDLIECDIKDKQTWVELYPDWHEETGKEIEALKVLLEYLESMPI